MPKPSSKKKSRPASPSWAGFSALLAVNALLAYAPFSLEVKLWIGLAGFLLVVGLVRGFFPGESGKGTNLSAEFLPAPALWFWVLLFAAALVLRFYKLTTLSVWPHYDEGVYGYYASRWIAQGDGRLFYGISRAPGLYVWILGIFFRLFGTSLSTLWLLPALVSFLFVPAAYLAARLFFSRSFALIVALLMAVGFWPLLLGRFSFMTGMVLLAECCAFYLLGKYRLAPTPSGKKAWAAALGFLLGLGFFIHLHWPVVAALVGGTLLAGGLRAKRSQRAAWLWALPPFLLLFVPFAYFFWKEGYGPFLRHMVGSSHGSWGSWLASVPLPCLSSLFWGLDLRFTYQPYWGGFLNSILASLFFWGAWGKLGGVSRPWLFGALGLFLLPGLLTADCEPFRMVPAIPILFVFVAAGATRLLAAFPKGKAAALGLALLLGSAGLDAYHLFAVYPRLWDSTANWRGYAKSLERYRAYELLDQYRRENGPGMVFGDFLEGLPDETLSVADFDFNAVRNPRLLGADCRWAAVLANVNLRPFLAKRFPGGKSAWLSRDAGAPDGGWMLWVMPLTLSRAEELKAWQRADEALAPSIDRAIGFFPGQTFSSSLEALQRAEPAFEGDPFLQTCFWEKTADLRLKDEMAASPHSHAGSIAALEQALRKGYPSAHLYEKLGVLYLMENRLGPAREAFQKAIKAPLNLTQAQSYLAVAREGGVGDSKDPSAGLK